MDRAKQKVLHLLKLSIQEATIKKWACLSASPTTAIPSFAFKKLINTERA